RRWACRGRVPQCGGGPWRGVGRRRAGEGDPGSRPPKYREGGGGRAARDGINHRGRIDAVGTPAELKAEIGRSTVEIVPEQARDGERLRTILSRFGTETAARPGGAAVQLDGRGSLADVVRALDQEDLRAAAINLHSPSLDDVFLAKTGRKLEGAAADDG